ncbi:MAG: hypothetical protein EZS28_029612 [Streblomastix strix]|uniref:Uncharacterized protein n=1 Tax=Streblomastix strix TaxID=222440 RepID=A0A5J4UXP2_9EUKA|nr:MAG: hypothetical protein EZS28_029612 [Streblomastix strix]
MRQAEEWMESGKGINEQGIGDNQQQQLQQADKLYEISNAHLIRVWSLLTRRSVDVDKVEHHIRIASQIARLAQEQSNTQLIAHSENANILRYVVDAGRAFRRAIVVAELMNTALDYSRYYMVEVLIVDQDGCTEVYAVYDEATGVTYPLLIELNQEYHQLYQWGYYNKVY